MKPESSFSSGLYHTILRWEKCHKHQIMTILGNGGKLAKSNTDRSYDKTETGKYMHYDDGSIHLK